MPAAAMRWIGISCLVLSAALGCSGAGTGTATAPASSTAAMGPKTVTGKVVDLFCYNPESGANSGMDHVAAGPANQAGLACALACMKWEGQPVGLVSADGTLYQLAGGLVADNNARIAPHATHTVTISGEVSEGHGILVLTASDVTMVSP